MDKKHLAKMALAALLLASGMPGTSQASDLQAEGTFLAKNCSGGCGSASGGKSNCGSSTGSEGTHKCGACGSPVAPSKTRQTPYDSNGNYDTPVADPSSYNPASGYGSYRGTNYGGSSSNFNRPAGYSSSHNGAGAMSDYSSGTSSYQGTSTGPGPNDGYPGSPRGSYNTNYNSGNTNTKR